MRTSMDQMSTPDGFTQKNGWVVILVLWGYNKSAKKLNVGLTNPNSEVAPTPPPPNQTWQWIQWRPNLDPLPWRQGIKMTATAPSYHRHCITNPPPTPGTKTKHQTDNNFRRSGGGAGEVYLISLKKLDGSWIVRGGVGGEDPWTERGVNPPPLPKWINLEMIISIPESEIQTHAPIGLLWY